LRDGIAGRTGSQLMLNDSVGASGGEVPSYYLATLSHELDLLRAFPNRVNLEADDKVPYHSAALAEGPSAFALICRADPAAVAILYDASSQTMMTPISSPVKNATNNTMPSDTPIDMSHFAHVRRVCRQSVGAPSEAQTEAFAPPGGGTPGVGDDERNMIRSLRAVGGWTNVDVHFTEFGGTFFNHNRLSGSPFSSAGRDVFAFIAQHCFIP
jgi:hypothetical protein